MDHSYINLTLDNLDEEHICCAISDKKHQTGVELKKEWLRKRIPEGHVFRKLRARGKVFIEYAPLESAWIPIEGKAYLYIYCLWVAGSYKKEGYGRELLQFAILEAKRLHKNGLCVITSTKKKPFLSEKEFFEQFGFKVVDNVLEYELLALSFTDVLPKFCETAKKMTIATKNLTIYYSPQCPFTAHCIEELKTYREEQGIPIHFEEIDSLTKAKQVPCVFNNWTNFKDGKFLSNTLLNKSMVAKLYE